MIDFTQPVYARSDGTYVVTYNGLPYHVLPTDPLFPKVAAWIKAGGQTQDEPPPPPVPEDQQIRAQLAALDGVISRDVEDLYAELGKTPALQTRVDAIAQKQELREKLKEMSNG